MYASHLNQARWSGSRRRDHVLLHAVEAAAVHLPELAADAGVAVGGSFGGPQRLVEQHEVERCADPRHRGDHVEPAEAEVEPVAEGVRSASERGRHPSRVAATGLPRSRRARRARSRARRRSGCRSACGAPRGSPLRAPVHEHAEPEPVTSLVVGVQTEELGDDLGVDVRALLGGRARGEPFPLPDRGVRVQHLALLVVGAARGRACARGRAGRAPRARAARRTRVAPLEQLAASSSALSSPGSSRIRRARRGAGRGSGRPRARP